MVFKVDFILGDIEDLLRITNQKLENIEKLLEFIMVPPDLVKYNKWKGDVNDMPHKKLSDVEK